MTSTSTLPNPPQLDVPPERRPRHIAAIMDGNGRWARHRRQPRVTGHRAGAQVVRSIVTECGRLGIEALTLYSFSIENWKRPEAEVEALMGLYLEYLAAERDELLANNVQFHRIGSREGLSPSVLDATEEMIAATKHCTGLKLVLALNYGSRQEITDAVRAIARRVASGQLPADAIDETTISSHLYTAGLPDPDLLIRTAGEFRISNYLLWQISYAELFVTETLWPDFTVAHLHDAIREYASRRRRYGGLDDAT